MIKRYILFISSIFLLSSALFAQLPENSWSYGFGVSYPKLLNTSLTPKETNYGGFGLIQRNFSEHVGLRFQIKYSHVEAEYWNPTKIVSTTDAFSANVDIIYYFVPTEAVSPYILFGAGGVYTFLGSQFNTVIDDPFIDYQINLGMGLRWYIAKDWDMSTEFNFHSVAGQKFDGAYGTGAGGSFFGGDFDTYMTINVGFQYYFSKGEPSKKQMLYSGLTQQQKVEPVDYNRIEEIIIRNKPEAVTTERVIEKPAVSMDQWVLVGIGFEFNSAELTPSSYPALLNAAKTLLANPDMRVEIQGHTDNVGSEKGNLKMSQMRADAVKNYLVARGIDASRLTTKGYGSKNPIADNKTRTGRAMNRRIEFKLIR